MSRLVMCCGAALLLLGCTGPDEFDEQACRDIQQFGRLQGDHTTDMRRVMEGLDSETIRAAARAHIDDKNKKTLAAFVEACAAAGPPT